MRFLPNTIKISNIGTNRFLQSVQTQIRLLQRALFAILSAAFGCIVKPNCFIFMTIIIIIIIILSVSIFGIFIVIFQLEISVNKKTFTRFTLVKRVTGNIH